jgi:transposase InsO family protein
MDSRLPHLGHDIFIPCTESAKAEELADRYLEYCYSYIGLPKVLISDRDPRFTAAFYRQFAARVGTDLRFTTAFHAQANGLAERNVSRHWFLIPTTT